MPGGSRTYESITTKRAEARWVRVRRRRGERGKGGRTAKVRRIQRSLVLVFHILLCSILRGPLCPCRPLSTSRNIGMFTCNHKFWNLCHYTIPIYFGSKSPDLFHARDALYTNQDAFDDMNRSELALPSCLSVPSDRIRMSLGLWH